MEEYYSRSPIAKRVEHILHDRHLFNNSDDSDIDPRSAYDTKQSRKKSRRVEGSPFPSKRANSLRSNSAKKRSKSVPKKLKKGSETAKMTNTTIIDKSHRGKSPGNHKGEFDGTSCLKEKVHLKGKIHEMEKTLGKQEKKMKTLIKKISTEKEEIGYLAEKLKNSQKKEVIIEELQDRVRTLQAGELSLIKELGEQQKIAQDAMGRLSNVQEDSVREMEKLKKYYREFYRKQHDEEKRSYEDKIQKLDLEKEKLLSELRNLETEKNLEKTKESIALSNEIVFLSNQVNQKSIENDRLKAEVKELKNIVRENERSACAEMKNLKSSIECLTEENRMLKVSEEDYSRRELSEKFLMKRRIDDLEILLQQKDNTIKEKDYMYKNQLEKINEKVYSLQNELSRLVDSEKKIDEVQKKLQMKDDEILQLKRYYKEKVQKRKTSQEEQKKEWSKIYNELLAEIRYLKGEIDNLGVENKKFMSSMNSRGGGGYRDSVLHTYN